MGGTRCDVAERAGAESRRYRCTALLDRAYPCLTRGWLLATCSISWARILAEGVAVVGSILLAFGIQAWWEERRDRVEERQALEALTRDFEEASRDIRRELLIIDSVTVAATIVLGWTGPDAGARHADSLAALLQSISRVPGFQPPMGALEALLSSGDLRLIRTI
jgi:hypothetical protein